MAAKTRLLTTVVAALVAAVALGAGARTALAAKHPRPTPPPTIIVDEGDYGAIIQAKVGQQIEIMLQDPWPRRYGWSMYEINGHAVAYRGHSSSSADGTVCYRMRAVREGSATCSMVCEPPPWLMMPARSFEVTFDVQP